MFEPSIDDNRCLSAITISSSFLELNSSISIELRSSILAELNMVLLW